MWLAYNSNGMIKEFLTPLKLENFQPLNKFNLGVSGMTFYPSESRSYRAGSTPPEFHYDIIDFGHEDFIFTEDVRKELKDFQDQ